MKKYKYLNKLGLFIVIFLVVFLLIKLIIILSPVFIYNSGRTECNIFAEKDYSFEKESVIVLNEKCAHIGNTTTLFFSISITNKLEENISWSKENMEVIGLSSLKFDTNPVISVVPSYIYQIDSLKTFYLSGLVNNSSQVSIKKSGVLY